MFNNYSLKNSLKLTSVSEKNKGQNSKSFGFVLTVLLLLFAVTGIQAQTNRIPIADGNFSNGSTFAANGWTVANQGVSPVKWAVGTAASGTSQTASLTASSTAVTLTAANAGITVGQIVYGLGIPNNTFVSAIAGTSLTLSQNATVTNVSATLGFGMFSGGISVNTEQLTTAISAAGLYNITLSAANPNISVGMVIAPIASIIAPNTYVAGISGTTLNLSQATLGSGAAQTLSFTATSAAITGNAAYVSNNNGATNSNAGFSTARTLYFHRDVTVPLSEKAMTVKFDVKSAPTSGGGWQVWAAPISQAITGTDTQVTTPFTYNVVWPGATLLSYNTQPQVATTAITAFVPPSFAGTTFKLIFVWAQSGAAVIPPAAIDNITLTSRIPEDIESIASGLWTLPSTWNVAKVPTPADGVAIVGSHTVMIDSKYSGAQYLALAGSNSFVLFGPSGTTIDNFTITSDLTITGSGARFNGNDGGTNGKNVRVGGNVDVGSSSCRLDISSNSTTQFNGALSLFGSTPQTVTVATGGFFGGSAAGINGFGNRANVLNQLIVTNTSTASPNVIFDANAIINGRLELVSGRVRVAAGKKLTIGNFGQTTNLFITPGSGFTGGTVSRFITSSNTRNIQPGAEYPGTDNNSRPYWFPFISSANLDRGMYLLPFVNPTTGGELAVTFTDAATVTGSLAITDGGYTINNRYNGNWSISTPDTSVTGTPLFYTNAAGTHRVMVYANGAYQALDGSSRLMNINSALAGVHQEGTAQPFVIRTGLTLADIIASPIYVGVKDGSLIASTNTITSTVTGGDRNWTTPATWVGGVVPSCTNNVIIATGGTVNVSATADAASVVINVGGTLTNNGGTMTVGCTNNNTAFINYGTHTMTSGTLKVNGFIAHKGNSFFNQTGGEISIDSNNNGDAATSVAFGGTSFKIETSNLALTGGKITIVDPLVNEGTTTVSATSLSNFSLNTAGASGTFSLTTTNAITTNTLVLAGQYNNFFIGQVVTGLGIPANTTVSNVQVGFVGFPPAITLTFNQNCPVASGTVLSFSSMVNGASSVVLEPTVNNSNLAIGQGVSGPGIQAGTTIVSFGTSSGIPASDLRTINLSLPVSGLGTSPITSQQTLTFATVTPGAFSTVLTAANPNIIEGMIVSGTGIAPGTFVSAYSGGTAIQFSQPIQPGAPSPLVLTFSPFNTLSSGSFIYNSPTHYAAGLNHTLQIGDGISTQKGALVSNGFNCQFQAGGGLFSLGNLTVDAPNGAERFMNVSSNNINSGYSMNVQNTFTITTGSVFKKTFANSPIYFGGNIVNNGTLSTPWQGTTINLGNFINGVAVPTTLPQTISGTGTFATNEWSLSSGPTGYSLWSLTINNTSAAGVTLSVPNFRVSGSVTLTNGILNTSAAFPIYCGVEDVTGPFFGGNFNGGSATSYINGPASHANRFDSTTTQYRLFPVGKNGKYLPISIASSGGVQLLVEAFDTNTGTTNPANASGLSNNRWRATRVGTAGTFTGYNFRIFANPDVTITASNLIVHATTDQGTYDIVNTPASAMTFSTGAINTLNLATAQTGGFLGNFSYASGVSCTGTPAPGATIASTVTPCGGQPITLSLTTPTTGAGVTYQWESSIDGGATWANVSGATAATLVATATVNTSYRCNVTCAAVTGTSTPIAVTVTSSTAVTSGGGTFTCGSTVNLTATGGTTLNWYDSPTSGTLLFTGANYSPVVTTTTTYHVATASETAGSINSATYTGTAASTALFSGIAFDVTNRVKLKTVTVYPKNTVALTPITVSLYDSTGNIVAGTTPVTFTPTLNTGTIGTVSQVVTLNYNIPAGVGYRLVANYGLVSTTNTLGNSTAVITYPTGSTIRLTGNVTDLTSAVSTTTNTTRCFHNLTFDEICESATRTPVTVTVTPTVTPTFTQVAAICSGGTLNALPFRSNNNITGTWSPALNNTATTTYTFTPDAGQCASTETMTITVNSIDFANLQFPFTQAICQGGTFTAYGQVYEQGITEAAGQGAGIDVEFGVSPIGSNTNPNTWTSWSPASFNVQVGNNDEYQFVAGAALPAGTYYYTFRYKLTACTTWQYGGTNNGFWNGTTNNSGVLTVDALTTNGSVTTSICAGGSYVWPLPNGTGLTYTTAQTNLTNTVGCNTATLNLTINTIDFANLQFPATQAICQGGTFTAYGQVYEQGITEAAGQGAGIDVEFGVSPIGSNTNPNTWTSWSPASFNVQAGNNDEYQFTAGAALTSGTYYYTFRYKLTACTTWQYGGTNNGFWNGTTNNSGVLTVNALPAIPTVVVTAPTCASAATNVLSTYSASLTYTSTPTGLTVGAGGLITGGTNGTSYTITATNVSLCAATTASFTFNGGAILPTPVVPTVTTTAPTCAAAGFTTISNYNAANTYTFLPTGPTAGAGGTITNATVGIAYTITSTNGGCTSASSASFTNAAQLTVPATPTGSATQTISVTNVNNATIANLVVNPTTGIVWYGSLANAQAGTNPLPTTTVLVSGSTYWAVNVGTTCRSTPFAVTVTVALGNEGFDNANFSFYPNPTSSIVNISYSNAITKVTVMNLLGQILQENRSNELQVTVDLSSYPSATYLVKVEADSQSKIIKVVKK